jgi:hypothetical protein
VLRACAVKGTELSLTFDDSLLGDDTIMVLQSTSNTFGWDNDGTPGDKFPAGENVELMMLAMALGPESPLEIQINGTNMTDGVWVPVNPRTRCDPNNIGKACPTPSGQPNNVVTAPLSGQFVNGPLAKLITGVRYGAVLLPPMHLTH